MKAVRKYSARLEGKPEGRRVQLVPEDFDEASCLVGLCKANRVTPRVVRHGGYYSSNGDIDALDVERVDAVLKRGAPVFSLVFDGTKPFSYFERMADGYSSDVVVSAARAGTSLDVRISYEGTSTLADEWED